MNLAIVSSFAEECGPAFYTLRLKGYLEEAGHRVSVLQLPVTLLRSMAPGALVRCGDREIERIAREAAEFDAVLIQFEPGLFGSYGWRRYERTMKILKAAKKVVLTVHGFDRPMPRPGFLVLLREALSGSGVSGLYRYAFGCYQAFLAWRTHPFWHRIARMPHVSLLTFCQADRFLFERLYGIRQVADFPIVYYSQQEIEEMRKKHDRATTLARYGLDPTRKYVAVAGFFGRYKGFLTAMKALEFLPEDYHLAIVGGEHPQGIEAELDIGGYLRQMLGFSVHAPRQDAGAAASAESATAGGGKALQFSLEHASREEMLEAELYNNTDLKYFLPDKSLKDRVHYVGQVRDEEMPPLYLALDYFVHPYIKTQTGQSGSGPATLALEFGANALFSNVGVFREMAKYFSGGMMFFNIGNFVELAQAILRHPHFAGELAERRAEAQKRYQPRELIAKYEALLEATSSA